MSLLGVPNFGVEVAKYLEREHKKMASGVETRGSAMSARDVLQAVRLPMEIVDGDDGRKVILYGEIGPKGIDAILSALRSAGFAVVPVEPTLEMIAAWDRVARPGLHAFEARYKAMLKAAQEDSRE